MVLEGLLIEVVFVLSKWIFPTDIYIIVADVFKRREKIVLLVKVSFAALIVWNIRKGFINFQVISVNLFSNDSTLFEIDKTQFRLWGTIYFKLILFLKSH